MMLKLDFSIFRRFLCLPPREIRINARHERFDIAPLDADAWLVDGELEFLRLARDFSQELPPSHSQY